MSVEFEKTVMKKLDLICNDISELKTDVAVLKDDVSELKTDVASLKRKEKTSSQMLKEIKEDTEMLKNEVFNVIKPKLNSIEQKVDIMTNVNTANILSNQTNNHKELIRKISEYEKSNELEHSRLNYEICKLAVNI